MGFNIYKKKVEKEVSGKSETAYFFAIELPDSYKGNRDPLKMNEKEIKQALSLLREERKAGKEKNVTFL